MKTIKTLILASGCAALSLAVHLSAHGYTNPKNNTTATNATKAATWQSSASILPAALAKQVDAAIDFRRLTNGDWLLLEKKQIRLINQEGNELANYKVRAKRFDVREHSGKSWVSMLDADTHKMLNLIVTENNLRVAASLPDGALFVDASCLFLDPQNLLHLFVIAKEGTTQQWLWHEQGMQLVRSFALPANTKQCQVDDDKQLLYVSEENMGIWAYAASSEDSRARQAVFLRQPYQALQHGPGRFYLHQGLLFSLDQHGQNSQQLWQLQTQPSRVKEQEWEWKSKRLPSLNVNEEIDHLNVLKHESQLFIAMREPKLKQWLWRAQVQVTMPKNEKLAVVMPQAQTELMKSLGDAADDPAIWWNPEDGQASRILGTNKKQGLLVNDMQGKELQFLESGKLNNVDVRQNVKMHGFSADLAVATRRDDNSLVLFTINRDGVVNESQRFATDLDQIYGMCLYQPKSGGLHVFANDKDGRYIQMAIEYHQGQYQAKQVRQFKLSSQPEGCVVDDQEERIFIGEEKRGIWITSAQPQEKTHLNMILNVGAQLKADVEGLALYHGKNKSYLIVSSQGDSSYVVLDASAPYQVKGRFRIGFNLDKKIDGSSETDGIDVHSANFGPDYPQGILVVQDGFKRMPEGAQNFKYVDWRDIAKALGLEE
jgi:3-phytase